MGKMKAGFMFIELLLVLMIIMLIAYKLFHMHLEKVPLAKETQLLISEQGIDTTSYNSIEDSTRNKLEGIQNNYFDELNKTEGELR